LTYLTGSGTVTINLNVLDASNNFNMYEFRCTGADNVRFIANGVTVYDNLNQLFLQLLKNILNLIILIKTGVIFTINIYSLNYTHFLDIIF
jgi:hypothetical protein